MVVKVTCLSCFKSLVQYCCLGTGRKPQVVCGRNQYNFLRVLFSCFISFILYYSQVYFILSIFIYCYLFNLFLLLSIAIYQVTYFNCLFYCIILKFKIHYPLVFEVIQQVTLIYASLLIERRTRLAWRRCVKPIVRLRGAPMPKLAY